MDNPEPVKGHEVYYDEISKRFVLEIFDKDDMFPLLIKAEPLDPRVIIVTKNKRLHLEK